ncbi:MAG: hypothetical protein AB7U83_01545 [Vicinamibacterales bacterium]
MLESRQRQRVRVPWAIAALAGGMCLTAIAAPEGGGRLQGGNPGPRLPIFEVDPNWPRVPAKWRLGEVSSVSVDAGDNVWVLHRPRTLTGADAEQAAPPVLRFDSEGHLLSAWGGPSADYEWPEREHGIYADPLGFVWIGGFNCPTSGQPGLRPVADDQLLKFTAEGRFVLQIGRSNQSTGNADTTNLHRPADQTLHRPTNELFVADGYGNHRVAVFDADTGRFKRMWGAFGRPPVDDDQCRVVNPTSFSDPGPPQFSIVHAIRISTDGLVYVADREFRRIQVFTVGGEFVKQLVRTEERFARALAFSPDPDQQWLYVGGGKGIVVLDRQSLAVVGTVLPPGALPVSHHIASDSRGNLYIAASESGLQKLAVKGHRP